MLLKLYDAKVSMKVVYLLKDELKYDPEYVALTQALTLDSSKPYMGLNGTYGLFGSKEWWESIQKKRISLKFISGVIKRSYVAGQDYSLYNNTIEVLLEDGSVQDIGIYVNKEEDDSLFKVGHVVMAVYVLDELKKRGNSKFWPKV